MTNRQREREFFEKQKAYIMGLPIQQKLAIVAYVLNPTMNSVARKAHKNEKVKEFPTYGYEAFLTENVLENNINIIKLIDVLQYVILSAPQSQIGIKVWRGEKRKKDENTLGGGGGRGSSSFLSTTLRKNIAKKFAGRSTPIHVSILPNSLMLGILDLGHHSKEKEVLLPIGTECSTEDKRRVEYECSTKNIEKGSMPHIPPNKYMKKWMEMEEYIIDRKTNEIIEKMKEIKAICPDDDVFESFYLSLFILLKMYDYTDENVDNIKKLLKDALRE